MKAVVLIAIIVFGFPALASARGRGGGRGGHSGHGGGHSSGGSRGGARGYGSGHAGHAHSGGSVGCAESSSIVGYRQCSGFGTWSWKVPALSFDLGVAGHRFVGQRLAASGTLTEGSERFGYRIVGEQRNLVTTAVAPQLRIALQLGGPFYVAGELEIGGVSSGPVVRGEVDGAPAGPVSTTYGAMRGVAGASVRMEPVVLSGELAGGMRLLSYKIKDEEARSYQQRAEVQARARLDVWLTPRLSVGAMVGTSLLERNDMIVALSIGGHLRAFGGAQ